MPKVNTRHADYIKFYPEWVRNSDCVAGQSVIKSKGQTYLPMPNSADKSLENVARYQAYLQRSVFHNVSGRTVENNAGQVFRITPTLELPPKLNSFETNIDGHGVGISQQAKDGLKKLLTNSRFGLWVDFPESNGVVTVKDAEENGIRPKILLFDATQIINWRVSEYGALSKLSLAVIESDYISNDDEFEAELKPQWIALRLIDEIYHVEFWREEDGDFKVFKTVQPQGQNGPFKEIPFKFVGSDSNDHTVDKPLLSDIANLNVAHYCDSADYQEAVYWLGQPTPWISGLTDDWVSEQLKGGVTMGSRSIIPLPVGASAGLLQVAPNTLPKEAMDQKELQMEALGAKLVERREVAVTATEAGMSEASESSVLADCANNVSNAYGQCFVWAGMFANENVTFDPNSLLFELNTEFAVSRITPEQIKAVLEAYNGKLITYQEARDKLKQGGLAFVDDALAKQEMDEVAAQELESAMRQFEAQKTTIEPAAAPKPASTPPTA